MVISASPTPIKGPWSSERKGHRNNLTQSRQKRKKKLCGTQLVRDLGPCLPKSDDTCLSSRCNGYYIGTNQSEHCCSRAAYHICCCTVNSRAGEKDGGFIPLPQRCQRELYLVVPGLLLELTLRPIFLFFFWFSSCTGWLLLAVMLFSTPCRHRSVINRSSPVISCVFI